MIKEILSADNFQKAYFDLVRKFDEKSLTARYSGMDGLTLREIDCSSDKIISEARKELENLMPVSPVISRRIPKRGGGKREIFIYCLKDRIKAQAIYRVIEPVFEKAYSPYLYSYRSSRPSYYAARSATRRYKRGLNRDSVLVMDLKQYSDFIDYELLGKKLTELKLESPVLELLNLFIKVPIFKADAFSPDDKSYGLVQGVPLIALFANIYLNDLDKLIGPKVSFYRRVGDDLIVFDLSPDKINVVYDDIIAETGRLKLKVNSAKTKIIKSREAFEFLGYLFDSGLIKLPPSTYESLVQSWRSKLRYSPVGEFKKIHRLKRLFFGNETSFHWEFLRIIVQYSLVSDDLQIKSLSEMFFRLLTIYFYGNFSDRRQRLVHEKLRRLQTPSLYRYYLDIHYGRRAVPNIPLSGAEED